MLLLLIALLIPGITSYIHHNQLGYKYSNSKHQDNLVKLSALKFDPSNFINIKVKKPLGISLVENEEGGDLGVCIDAINEGSIKSDGKAYKGLYLLSVDGKDLKFSTFDQVMDTLIDAPADKVLDLVFIDPRYVMKGEAILSVTTQENKVITVKALKGQILRNVLKDNNIEVYSGKAKFGNCGGGGSCGTCVVSITNNNDWEKRPEFESLRLKKYDTTARLSCNAIVEGDCSVIVQPSTK